MLWIFSKVEPPLCTRPAARMTHYIGWIVLFVARRRAYTCRQTGTCARIQHHRRRRTHIQERFAIKSCRVTLIRPQINTRTNKRYSCTCILRRYAVCVHFSDKNKVKEGENSIKKKKCKSCANALRCYPFCWLPNSDDCFFLSINTYKTSRERQTDRQTVTEKESLSSERVDF